MSGELRQRSYRHTGQDGQEYVTQENSTECVTVRYLNGSFPGYHVEVLLRSGQALPFTEAEWSELKLLVAGESVL